MTIIMDNKTLVKVKAAAMITALMIATPMLMLVSNATSAKTNQSEICSQFLDLKSEIDTQVFIQQDLAAELGLAYKKLERITGKPHPYTEAGDPAINASFNKKYKAFKQMICK